MGSRKTDSNPDTKGPNNEIASPSGQKHTQAVVCVFCGASSGKGSVHLDAARELAHELYKHNIKLVYGGGTKGLMGILAETLVSLAGPDSVHGYIPEALLKHEATEIDEARFGRVTVVKDMHTRKQMMAREVIEGAPGGGFVILTGGFGTLEEFSETVTWNQLGIHEKAVVVYNVKGYWDYIFQWAENAEKEGFVKEDNKGIMVEATSAEEVVQKMRDYKVSAGRLNLQWEHK